MDHEPPRRSYTVTLVGRTGVVEVNPAALAAARHRVRPRLSQKRLAELVGVGHDQISEWECGKHRPDIHSLYRLATVLEVPVRDLLAPGTPVTLRVLRICAGITQQQLADKLGMSHSTWSSIERGTRPLRVGEAELAALELDTTPAELVRAAARTATPAAGDTQLEVVTLDPDDDLAAAIEADRQPGETTLDVLRRWAPSR